MQIKNRKINRLQNYNYSQNGFYFVTICTKDRIEYFGEIKNRKMVLNEYGKIVEKCWLDLPNYYSNCVFDEFMIMPNHLHCIIKIYNVGTDLASVQIKGQIRNVGLLSKIIQGFKSKTTVEFIKLMKSKNKPYNSKIWQRSFCDHIIRNEISLNKIREYIQMNSMMWERDRNNNDNL